MMFQFKLRLFGLVMAPGLFLAAACSKSHSAPFNDNSQPSPGDVAVSFSVNTSQPGTTVPSTFEGLSFEAGSMTSTSYFLGSNSTFINLIKGLGSGIIRVGGNSVDKTHWTGAVRGVNTGTDSIATDDVDRFFGFAEATGWKVMFGLNLGSGTAATAASEAGYVYSHYNSELQCFEIGNEPDLYNENGLRPTTYNYTDFRQQFEGYYDTIKAAVPGAIFSGPTAASNTKYFVVPFVGDEHSRIGWVTQHYYKMGPPTNPSVTIAALLNGNASIIGQADAIAAAAIVYGLPYRIAECNSVYDGGAAGVSNTLASALWGLDYMFALAEQGCVGVNFHGGGAGNYTPIAWSSGQFSARPLYYGMLLFSKASQGNLLTVSPAISDSLNLTAHAVLQSDGTVQMTLINKDTAREAYVTVSDGHSISSAVLLRLTGPSAASTSGILLGGSTAGSDGNWSAIVAEQAAISGTHCYVKVPAASAVLISLR